MGGSAVDLAGVRVSPTASGDLELSVSEVVTLAASQVVRLQAAHNNGGDMNVDAEISIIKLA